MILAHQPGMFSRKNGYPRRPPHSVWSSRIEPQPIPRGNVFRSATRSGGYKSITKYGIEQFGHRFETSVTEFLQTDNMSASLIYIKTARHEAGTSTISQMKVSAAARFVW
jgi:hypothetical protein